VGAFHQRGARPTMPSNANGAGPQKAAIEIGEPNQAPGAPPYWIAAFTGVSFYLATSDSSSHDDLNCSPAERVPIWARNGEMTPSTAPKSLTSRRELVRPRSKAGW
jgi:hypothetical protein